MFSRGRRSMRNRRDPQAPSQRNRFCELRKVYRNYLYLDADAVINAISVLDEGQVVDEVRVIQRELGGDIGVKLGVASQGLSLGAKGGRRIEQHLTVRRTIHTYVERLLEVFEREGIASIERPTEVQFILENALIECDVDLIPPLRRSSGPSQGLKLPKIFRGGLSRLWGDDPVRQWVRDREAAYGGRFCLELGLLQRDGELEESDEQWIVLELETKWVTAADLADLTRRATVVGQVIGVARVGEELRLTPSGASPFYFDTSGDVAVASSEPLSSGVSTGPPNAESLVLPTHSESGPLKLVITPDETAAVNESTEGSASPAKDDARPEGRVSKAKVVIKPLAIFK